MLEPYEDYLPPGTATRAARQYSQVLAWAIPPLGFDPFSFPRPIKSDPMRNDRLYAVALPNSSRSTTQRRSDELLMGGSGGD